MMETQGRLRRKTGTPRLVAEKSRLWDEKNRSKNETANSQLPIDPPHLTND